MGRARSRSRVFFTPGFDSRPRSDSLRSARLAPTTRPLTGRRPYSSAPRAAGACTRFRRRVLRFTRGSILMRDSRSSATRAAIAPCSWIAVRTAFAATAAHAHADCLAIALGAFGEPLLIDPGTFTYHAEPRFRTTSGALPPTRTLRVDGEEQSETGRFLWGAAPNPRRARRDPRRLGRHRREPRRLRAPFVAGAAPTHRGVREARLLLGHGRALGEGEHLAESFGPLYRVARSPPMRRGRSRAPAGAELHLQWVGPNPRPPLELWEGAEHPIQGWSSPRFGVRVPAPVLRLAAARRLPWRSSMLVRPIPAMAEPQSEPVVAGMTSLGTGEVLWARGMPGEDLLLRDNAAGELAIPGRREPLALRGRLALLRRQGRR